ncbi:aminoglycoside phosphotransferase [Catenulispora acidiphila DSM 44928]|uniref:Aminoglycoside phosphotransferase n=1 Tax=Catenulispora acidiphila (strain DSM 44928 / JCM 14897 / NBRC 102108 / NRRL B-24433 / ID139908) TaxID=479433 RepID=C7QEW1_CATAD|nr:phosphotransferase [Catenulispora acidiphila]ACU72881.1 aminoglycoside phosphotransferase [Catenulispora acidiphila DSM 44928]
MVRATFTDLPDQVLAELADLAGPVKEFIPAVLGNHADVVGELRTSRGRAFIKGARLLPNQRGGGAEAWSLLNEAEVLHAVRPYAPELLWRFDVAGWRIVGFEFVHGRHADYAPGSPDLEPISVAVEELATRDCPPSVKLRVEDRYRALDDRAGVFASDGLVHCDLSPDNVLITVDGAVRIVDWAFVSRGASWLEFGFMMPWLIRAGHSPQAAESWLARFPLWSSADPEHTNLFASLLNQTWSRRNVEGAPPWLVEYAGLVRAWLEARTATSS